MAFTKITNEDLQNKGVATLPDTPDMEASELKQRFDSLGNLAIDRINNLITELEAESAALSVGATVPSGITAGKNVQSIINALTLIIQRNEELRHTHPNLEVLDTITEEDKAAYDANILRFSDITSVERIVHDSDSEIPTSGAVVDYVNARISAALGS